MVLKYLRAQIYERITCVFIKKIRSTSGNSEVSKNDILSCILLSQSLLKIPTFIIQGNHGVGSEVNENEDVIFPIQAHGPPEHCYGARGPQGKIPCSKWTFHDNGSGGKMIFCMFPGKGHKAQDSGVLGRLHFPLPKITH
jgi:hypothetical protein